MERDQYRKIWKNKTEKNRKILRERKKSQERINRKNIDV